MGVQGGPVILPPKGTSLGRTTRVAGAAGTRARALIASIPTEDIILALRRKSRGLRLSQGGKYREAQVLRVSGRNRSFTDVRRLLCWG